MVNLFVGFFLAGGSVMFILSHVVMFFVLDKTVFFTVSRGSFLYVLVMDCFSFVVQQFNQDFQKLL